MDVLARANLPFPESLPEFQGLFPDDAACASYLEKSRWSEGFVCPHCGSVGAAQNQTLSGVWLRSITVPTVNPVLRRQWRHRKTPGRFSKRNGSPKLEGVSANYSEATG